MHKLTVGVLRGGPGPFYETSLKSGGLVLKHLPEKYRSKDIFISREGEWHHDGFVKEPHQILRHVDVVFNALHGDFGENGKVQKLIEHFDTPYSGSDPFASSISFHKHLSKPVLEDAGLSVPTSFIVEKGEDIAEITQYLFENVPLPLVIKPTSMGAIQGITLLKSYRELPQALEFAFQYGDKVLIEEFIRGKEASVGIIENFRGQQLYALVPIEVNDGDHLYPSTFTDEERGELENIAKAVHKALSLRHYSKVDMIVTPRKKIYVLEANTLPRFEEGHVFPKALDAVGCPFPDFIDHVLTETLKR
jgi:D-alanine-D-alanine ligase